MQTASDIGQKPDSVAVPQPRAYYCALNCKTWLRQCVIVHSVSCFRKLPYKVTLLSLHVEVHFYLKDYTNARPVIKPLKS
jgi:hypothetical protein